MLLNVKIVQFNLANPHHWFGQTGSLSSETLEILFPFTMKCIEDPLPCSAQPHTTSILPRHLKTADFSHLQGAMALNLGAVQLGSSGEGLKSSCRSNCSPVKPGRTLWAPTVLLWPAVTPTVSPQVPTQRQTLMSHSLSITVLRRLQERWSYTITWRVGTLRGHRGNCHR